MELQSNLEKRFQSVFESAVDGIIIINARGIILDLNVAATKLFGYTKEELKGLTINHLMPVYHATNHDDYIKKYLKTGQPKIIGIGREVEGIKKNGGKFPFWLSVNEVKLDDESIFTGFIHDLSAVKKAELELVKLNHELENKVVQRTYDLEKVVNQLLQLNKKLEEEIHARKETEIKLKQRETDLEESLNKEKELGILKSRFVSMASHEFRTPLATIASSASLVLRYTGEEDQNHRTRHIEKIKSSVSHLTNILNDFLSITKLEEGKITVKFDVFDLKLFLGNFIEEITPLFVNQKKLETSIELTDSNVCNDSNIIKNILFNLLSNAIKYTKDDGRIRLIVRDNAENLYFSIEDDGIGIPEHEQKHLFDRFFRAGNATNIEGTGLGLYIVKKYVENLNGSITFTSGEAQGTSFHVTLPKVDLNNSNKTITNES